ncbi:MAG: hypothetical protein IPP53_00420 [Bacteroidetes bacterium]|nr:hypothetical protein [Bacteroidota bacterium]MBL0077604.1 hypothetical protein [Bacteroidota bacterium]
MKNGIWIFIFIIFSSCGQKENNGDPVQNMSAAEKYYNLQKIRKIEQDERYNQALQEQQIQQEAPANTFNPEQEFLEKYNTDYNTVPVE